jgi:hypothetical protein
MGVGGLWPEPSPTNRQKREESREKREESREKREEQRRAKDA